MDRLPRWWCRPRGGVRLAAEVEQALAGHLIAVGATGEVTTPESVAIIGVRAADCDATALIRSAEPAPSSGLTWHRPTLEELLLGYLRMPAPQRIERSPPHELARPATAAPLPDRRGNLSAVCTAVVLVGAHAIRHQVAANGIVVENYAPERTGLCVQLVSCLPAGAATNMAQLIALIAVFVPLLIGLTLAVPLFARARENSPDAYILTQSLSRSRWLFTKLGWALTAGASCTAAVAVTFRPAAARYTLIVNNSA